MPSATTPLKVETREHLLHLLAEAAEFEHNLLCCYLYAAFSLKRGALSDFSPDEAQAVARWHRAIMSVALEEMVHLALVANLTVALGARPHFDRPNLPVPAGYHPADIVVALAPFDLATLTHFIYLERPEGVTLSDGEGFAAEGKYQRGKRLDAFMPDAYDYDTIAELYAGIRTGFVQLVADRGEAAVFIGDAAMQVGPDVVSLPGLTVVTDLATAAAAIDTIVLQGEGAPGQHEKSHFTAFLSIKSEFEALRLGRADFESAWPVARNPVMRQPIEQGRVYIDHPGSAQILDLANAIYNHMLRVLGQGYGRSEPVGDEQKMLLDAAMKLMGIFAAVGAHLASLPASASAPGTNAGVSFALLRSTQPLIEARHEWTFLSERLSELARGARNLFAAVPALALKAQELEALGQTFAKKADSDKATALGEESLCFVE